MLIVMTLMNMRISQIDTRPPCFDNDNEDNADNINDNYDDDVERGFPRSTPDLLALMEAFAFSINSPVLQRVLLIIITVIISYRLGTISHHIKGFIIIIIV